MGSPGPNSVGISPRLTVWIPYICSQDDLKMEYETVLDLESRQVHVNRLRTATNLTTVRSTRLYTMPRRRFIANPPTPVRLQLQEWFRWETCHLRRSALSVALS